MISCCGNCWGPQSPVEVLIYSFRLPGQGWYSQILGFLGERKSLDNLWDLWLFRWFSHCKPWKNSWNWIGALFHDEKHNDNNKVPTGLAPSHFYKKCMKILGSNLSVIASSSLKTAQITESRFGKTWSAIHFSHFHSVTQPSNLFVSPRLSLPACTSAVIACVPRTLRFVVLPGWFLSFWKDLPRSEQKKEAVHWGHRWKSVDE